MSMDMKTWCCQDVISSQLDLWIQCRSNLIGCPSSYFISVDKLILKFPWKGKTPRRAQFSSVQSLSRVQLFATPWITACQASLSITISQSSLRLTSIESVMPSSHLILQHPLLLLPPIPPSIRVFSNESTLRMRWPKYWSFSFSIIPSKVLLSYKKEGIWVSSNEVDETRTYYIKWSQKEKNKYCILTYIYMELRKTVLAILHARQQSRHRCKEQAFGFSGRR